MGGPFCGAGWAIGFPVFGLYWLFKSISEKDIKGIFVAIFIIGVGVLFWFL